MITLFVWALFGLVVGIIVKLITNDEAGLLSTMVIGVCGSFMGGLIEYFLNGGGFRPSGFIFSIIGGVLFCWLRKKLF